MNKILISILSLQLALPILSTDIYLSSLKIIKDDFHTSIELTQFTLTLYFLIFGIVQLFFGLLSDRFGRKPVLFISLIIYFSASLMCAFSSSIKILIIGRCFQAWGAGGSIIVFAIIRDLYDGDARTKWIAFMSGIVALSPIISPIIGGYIQMIFSWRSDFIFLFLIGVILFFYTYQYLPETCFHQNMHDSIIKIIFNDYRYLFSDRQFVSNAFSAAFAFGALFSYVSGAPYILLDLLKLSSEKFSWIFASAAIGYVIGCAFNHRFVSKTGIRLMSCIGMLSLVAGSITMVLSCIIFNTNVFAVILPQILCEFGIAIIVSTTIANALENIPEHAGTGSGLIGFLRFLMAAVSSYLVIHFHSHTALPLALIILCLSLLSFISILFIKNEK